MQEQQRSSEMMSAGIGILGGVLGAMFGRGSALSRTNIGKAATAARQAGKVVKEQGDVGRAGDTVEAVNAQIAKLEQEVEAAVAAITTKLDAASAEIETLTIRPKKLNISIGFSSLVWAPCKHEPGKDPEPAW